MNSAEIYNHFIAVVASGKGSDDVIWSSAMDMQVKLVDNGTTYEPAVFIFNKRLVAADEVPRDHAAFAKLITAKSDKFKSKVTTYDIEKSGVGFMFVVQDAKFFPGMKELK